MSTLARFVDEVGEDGRRLVLRNGRARERRVTVGSGTVPIKVPRLNDTCGDEEAGGAAGWRTLDRCKRARALRQTAWT